MKTFYETEFYRDLSMQSARNHFITLEGAPTYGQGYNSLLKVPLFSGLNILLLKMKEIVA